MFFDENGLDLQSMAIKFKLKGEPASLDGFLEKVTQLNKRNSIFIDITASEDVSKMYAKYLKQKYFSYSL